MGEISETAADVYRPFVTSGVPASGANEPSKTDITNLFTMIERAIGGAVAGLKFYATKAALDADTTQPAGTLAYVYDDPGNNGVYHYKAGGWVVDTAYAETVFAVAQPIINDSSVDVLKATFGTALTVGGYTGTLTTANPEGNVVATGLHFLQRAVLVGIRANCGSTTTLGVRVARLVKDSGKHIGLDQLQLPVAATGPNVWSFADLLEANDNAPLICDVGDLIAFAGGGIRNAVSTEPYHVFPNGLNDTPSTTVLSFDTAGKTFDIEFLFQLAAPQKALPYLELETIETFSELPSGWRQFNANPTFAGGAAVLTSAGFTNQMYSAKPYGLDRRSIRADIQFTTANAHLMLETNPTDPVDSGQAEGSMMVYQASNSRFLAYQRWDGLSTIPAVDTADNVALTGMDGAAFTITTGHTYTAEIAKNYRDYTARLTDPTGPGRFSRVVSNGQRDTYTAAYGTHTKYGLLHGSPGIATVQGSIKLFTWRHTADYNQFLDWYVVGDSKTEGYAVEVADRYVKALTDRFGERNVAVSGVGGATSRGAVFRSFIELDAMRPRNVLINVGANTGDEAAFATNLATMVRIAKNAGARVFVATVPTSADKTAAVNALSGVTVVNLGTATTVNGSGSARIAAFYAGTRPDDGQAFNDGLHENALGHQRVAGQMLRDTGLGA